MPTVKIIKQAEEARFNVGQKLQYMIRVDFMVDDDGPFTEWFLKPAYTREDRDATLQAFANQVER